MVEELRKKKRLLEAKNHFSKSYKTVKTWALSQELDVSKKEEASKTSRSTKTRSLAI